MPKQADPVYPIHELISKRWSPYAFDFRPVPKKELQSLFEAARWAASSYNEQPWHYIVATREDPKEFEAIGYPGDVRQLPDKLKERDLAPRSRKPIGQFVFGGKWGKTSPVVL